MKPVVLKKTVILISAILAGATLADCGGKADAGATGAKSEVAGSVALQQQPRPAASGKAAMFLAVDTARPRLITGRNAHDSVSFFSTA